jgi:hypothetical protein
MRAYQGEVVVFDLESASGRRFANFTVANVGWQTFAGFSIVNVHSSYGPILAQGTHPGIVIKGVRIQSAGFGLIYNPLTDAIHHRILGSHLENGVSTGFDCSAQTGSSNGDYVGCSDMIIQDAVFIRTGTGSDHIGMEAGSNILFSRVRIESQTPVANDCFDVKANYIWIDDLQVFGCSAKGVTAWGYNRYRNVLTDGHSDVVSEYTSRDVDGAVDDGGFIKITATYSPYGGQVPIPGHRVTISDVQGCTSANGTWRIKDAVSKDVFRIMGDNGEGTTCNGTFTYDAAARVKLAPPLDLTYGADVRYSTFATAGGYAVSMLYNMSGAIPWAAYDSIFSSASSSGSAGICASALGPIRNSNRNQFWTGRGQAYATGYSGGGTCTSFDGNNLATNEPASHFGDAALATTTYRATASSPSTLANRGYYAGTNTATGGEARMIVKWRAPAATDSCTTVLDDSSDFSSPVETINTSAGQRWREIVFGVTTPLSASTTYYHRITCGYDVFTGSAMTMATTSGTASLTAGLGAPVDAAQTQAALDYSTDGSSWTSGTPTACSTGCTLTASSLERGQIYYIRTRRVAAGGQTLVTSDARPHLIPQN